MTRRQRRFLHGLAVYSGALVVLVIMAFPLYNLFLTSIQRERDVRSPDISFIPEYILLDHYRTVLSPGHIVPIREAMFNSFLVSTLTAIITMTLAVPATYALTRLRLPGRTYILLGMASIYLLPTILFIFPLFIQAVRIGLVDTYVGLLIPYVAFTLPFTIIILRAFLQGVPIEIEEAARIDGCNQFQLFFRIVLPLMKPGIFAGLLMLFILSWIEFLTPLLFTRDIQMLTVVLGLYRSTYDIQLGQLAAAAILASLPVVLLVVIFQRLITRVVVSGGADQ
jgi:multiple sugar transport system permease protein